MWVAHRNWLTGVIRDFRPDMVVWEKPILALGGKDGKSSTTLASVMILCGLQAITGLTCRDLNVPCRTATVGQAKIALAGRGNASKEEMIEAARQYDLDIEHPDEADAFAVWLHVVRLLDPRNAPRFDLLFMRP